MGNLILQSFLDNQFIKTDETSHIDSLKKASAAVQKMLEQKKNRSKLIPYTLVALDPTVSGDDPIVVEVDRIIIKQWSTFRNSVVKTQDSPISYVQAVILEALNGLSKDINLSAIIWHTGCNIVNHYRLVGQEKVLTDFLLEIGKQVEEEARNNWAILEGVQVNSIDPFKITVSKVSQGKVSQSELQAHLMAAAGQQGAGGENPQWPSHNAAPWPSFFSERAAEGLSEEINAALISQNKSLESISSSIQESIEAYFSNLKPHLELVSSSILQSSLSLNKRSDLLWWKQALYSSRLETSYRKLEPITLAVIMAVDLADSVSPIYPKSVDFFLAETLRDVLGEEIEKRVLFTELIDQLQQFSDAEKLLLENLYEESENRKPLGACLSSVLKEKITTDEFFTSTGIDKNAKISLEELIVWLFHDLQANTLVNAK